MAGSTSSCSFAFSLPSFKLHQDISNNAYRWQFLCPLKTDDVDVVSVGASLLLSIGELRAIDVVYGKFCTSSGFPSRVNVSFLLADDAPRTFCSGPNFARRHISQMRTAEIWETGSFDF